MDDEDIDQIIPEADSGAGKEQETQAEDTAEEQDGAEGAVETEEGTEAEAEEAESAQGEEPEQAKPTKRGASETIRALKAERNAERAEREKLVHERAVAQVQLENLRAQQRELQSAAEKRAEDERLALLDPTERASYQSAQQIRNLEWRLNNMEVQRKNDQDRATFQAKAAHDETYGKYADQVEQMYEEGLARGVSASREDLHSYILGRELKKDLAAKVSEKKKSAGKRIESVTSKPASARGDVAGSKKGKSEEDRLRGVLI